MTGYAFLKAVHVGCAVLSLSGFVLRFVLMLRASPWLRARAARVLPHLVDTVLLGSALAMVWQVGSVPDWLAVKIAALLAYIVLGTFAIKRGKTLAWRATAGVAAVAVFAFIVSVARSKLVWGLFGGLFGG